MDWVDSHCNYEDERLKPHIKDILLRAKQAGIIHSLNICSKISDLNNILNITDQYKDMLSCSVGTHPHHSGEETESRYTVEDIINKVRSHKSIVAIGESGLDFHYNYSEPKAQEESFRRHIRACLETNMPLIIHARESDQEIQDIITSEAPNGQLRGVLHCYASGSGLAEWGIDYGLYISFSGIVTFNNACDIQEIARDIVPLERMMVETDAPYLAPMPLRGRTNEPSLLPYIGKFLSDLKNTPIEIIAQHTTHNFFNLFGKADKLV